MMNEPPQEYCLRWNKHQTNIIESFESLLDNGALVDVTLFSEGQLLKAHKVVLSACSSYFETLFAQTRDKHPIVILKDVKVEHLRALLDFMYRGHVNVSQQDLNPLLKTARELNIKGLADGLDEKNDIRNSGPMSLVLPVSSNSHSHSHNAHYSQAPSTSQVDTKPLHRPPHDRYDSPSVTMPSVLSTALTMPSALSLNTPLSLPHLSSLPHSLASSIVSSLSNVGPHISHSMHSFHPPREMPVHPDRCESPHIKRKRKHRRRSGEGLESGDSDGRSSGSPGDSISNLNFPRIPATITPVSAFRQQQQQPHQLPQQNHQQQQQPRDLSMHSTHNNHYNSHPNSHNPVSLKSPHRPLSVKPHCKMPLLPQPPPVDNHHKLKSEPDKMEVENLQPPEHRYLKTDSSVGQEPTDEKSSSSTSNSPPSSQKREEEKPEPNRPSPKNGSDPESLTSPTKRSVSHTRLDETSSDNNHYSDDEIDENSNGPRERYERLSDSTPGPSTSRPHSEEAPNTPNYLWPYTSDHASADEPFSNLGENSNHGFWKNSFKGGLLAPYLGSPLAPLPHSPHSHGLATTFPGLYANPGGPPPGWSRGSASPPNLSLPPHLRSNECSRCGRLYKTRKGLKHHIKNECGVEPRFQCTHCDWKFKQKAHLLRHMARKHTFS